MELFEACISWIKSSSNHSELTKEILHAELGDLMKKIRFGSMSTKEIASLIPFCGNLFSVDEYQELIQLIGLDEYQPKMLTADRRKRAETIIPNDSPLIECDRLISTYCSVQEYYVKDIETTVFSCNQPLLLIAFICTGIFGHGSSTYKHITETISTAIEVIEQCGQSHSETVLHTQETILLCNRMPQITLAKPILIKPRHKYNIRMQQSPPFGCCTGSLLKSEVQIQPDITVRFHDDPGVGDDEVARGLISKLDFNKF